MRVNAFLRELELELVGAGTGTGTGHPVAAGLFGGVVAGLCGAALAAQLFGGVLLAEQVGPLSDADAE